MTTCTIDFTPAGIAAPVTLQYASGGNQLSGFPAVPVTVTVNEAGEVVI